VRKNSKNFSVVYPDEKEGRSKDANRKLRSEVKNLKKRIRQLESHNKTIERAYSKSCNFIQDKLSNKTLEEVLNMVKNYEHKETEKGRNQSLKEKPKVKGLVSNSCPKCGNIEKEGYAIFGMGKFTIESCACGYRKKADSSEGIERS